MGFGSLATAFYSRKLITEAALNESHGITDPGKSNMRYFHQRLEFHKYVWFLFLRLNQSQVHTFRDGVTTEYKTMRRAVEALFHRFPSILDDITQAKQNTKPLISKIRKVGSLSPSRRMHEFVQILTRVGHR